VQIRLLALSGRVNEANNLGEQFLKKQRTNLQAILNELPKDQAKKLDPEEALTRQQLALARMVGGGFQGAKAYDQAEAWARRGLELAEALPEKSRADGRINFQVLLAEAYMERGRHAMWPFLRSVYNNKAIDIFYPIYTKSKALGNNLAWLLTQERGDTKAALDIIEWVRKGEYSEQPCPPERLHPQILDTLAVVYREAEQYKKSEELLKGAAKQYADDPHLAVLTARHYAAQKMTGKAKAELNRAASLFTRKAEATPNLPRRTELLEQAVAARREHDTVP